MNRNSGSRATLKRLMNYCSHARVFIVFSLVLALISVVLTLYLPILTGQAVDLLIGPDEINMDALMQIFVRMAITVFFTSLAQWLMSLCNNRITYSSVREIRCETFRKIEALPLSYIDAQSSGDIVSRIVSDVDTLADGLLMGFGKLFTGVATILGTLVFMFGIDLATAMVVVIVTPLSLFVSSFIAKKTYAMFRLQTITRGEATACINETVSGEKVIRAFGRDTAALEKFDEINGRLKRFSLRATFFSSLTNPSTRFVNSLVYAGVCIFGALNVITRGLSVGQLSCFLNYADRYTKPFNEISGVITELQNAIACAERVFELIDTKPEQPDDELEELDHVNGRVRFDDVSFSYVKDRPLIENLDLNISPGQRVAIVGPTGCGKTTIINLLMRFYDVDSGHIEVDGHDIRSVKRLSLRRNYGMVLQDSFIRTGTVRENIALACPEATEKEIIRAAKAAKAHSFIMRLPKGYDTVLSGDAAVLSEGEKQLLCIARAMLRLPPMLILDEATSSIDSRTERKIQDAFAKLMEGHTSFVVAHRLSTIENADLILVMREGRIIERGTHAELMSANGAYAQLYNSALTGSMS